MIQKTVIAKMMKMNKPVRLKSNSPLCFSFYRIRYLQYSARSHSFCLFCLFGLLIVVSNS
ncbi:hypothetical protein HanPSC8_Chr13g0561771 [Helianthus annuus]|nr:hypothetical protein HanPSC8_Chr13g0561771 [Helianthus annuus]